MSVADRKQRLRAWLKLLSAAGAATFLAIFLYGILSPGPLSGETLDLGGIDPGEAELLGWEGKPVWAVRYSISQRQASSELDGFVHISGRDEAVRDSEHDYGIFLARTEMTGVLHQYVVDRPQELPAEAPWYGGFIDPAGDAVFDFTGRRYRTTEGPDLTVPPHRYLARELIEMGNW